MGVAHFPELVERGVYVVMHLTKKRGLRFVVAMNAAIVLAATTACRTYCSVMNERLNCDCYRTQLDAFPAILTDVSVQFLKSYMIRGMVDAIGELGNSQSFVNALHRRNFGYIVHPNNELVLYIPRQTISEYLLAVASMSHARLGAASAGHRLDADVLGKIAGLVDFH